MSNQSSSSSKQQSAKVVEETSQKSSPTNSVDTNKNAQTQQNSVPPVSVITASSAAPSNTTPTTVQSGIPFSGGVASSLYVGELLPEVNESVLFELFSPIGAVSSIRVCRNAITRVSLGYAYVNFHNAMDAERAIEILNYTPIRGKPCRIMWSQRDPYLRKSGSGNVFIKNLSEAVDNKALHDTFSVFGTVLSCKVVLDDQGRSKGFAFVQFESAESAQKAIDTVNGKSLDGKIVFVGHYVSRKERNPKTEEIKSIFTNIFVKNLDLSVDEKQFLALLTPFGSITSFLLQTDEQGKSKGFGFANFESHESAQKAIDELNGKEICGKAIFVGRAQLKTERLDELKKKYEQMREENDSKLVNLYVKNLDDQIDEEKLKEEFSSYGPISSIVIMKDEKGISKGFGFVSFENTTDATKACTELNGKIFFGKPLYVAHAQRKEDRRLQLEALYSQRMMKQLASPVYYHPAYAAAAAAHYHNQQSPNQFRQPSMMINSPNGGAVVNGANSGMIPQPSNTPSSMMMMMRQHNGSRPQIPYVPYHQMMMNNNTTNGTNSTPNGARQIPPHQYRSAVNNTNGAPHNNSYRYSSGGAGGVGNTQRPRYSKGGSSFSNRSANTNSLNQNQQNQTSGNKANHGSQNSANALTAASLAAASPEEQKQMLGDRLFGCIKTREPEMAGKITGMLLEMDNGEILHLLESPELLNGKIDEAMDAIRFDILRQQQQQPQVVKK